MPKVPARVKKGKKSSQRKRKPLDSNQRFINRLGRRLIKEKSDSLQVRAAIISNYVGIPLRPDDFTDLLTERLKAAMEEALAIDLQSPDPRVRQIASERVRRLHTEKKMQEPVLLAPAWIWERRRQGRPRKDEI